MTTFMEKKADVKRNWYILDATDIPLGRLASKSAHILRGKHKVTFNSVFVFRTIHNCRSN